MASAARLRRAGPILASAVLASMASTTVVYAEAPPKKSIYDDHPFTTITPRKPQPSPLDKPTAELASYIRTSRLFLHDQVTTAQQSLDTALDKYLSLEQSFTNTIASLAPSRDSKEQVLPGSIYILVSAMAGGVISRNRMFPLRFLTPVIAGVAASWVFLPETTRNIADLAWKYEEKYPAVAEAHLKARKSVEDGWKKGEDTFLEGKKAFEGKVNDGRSAIEGWIRRQ